MLRRDQPSFVCRSPQPRKIQYDKLLSPNQKGCDNRNTDLHYAGSYISSIASPPKYIEMLKNTIIHKSKTKFNKILFNQKYQNVERQLIELQNAVKDSNSESWELATFGNEGKYFGELSETREHRSRQYSFTSKGQEDAKQEFQQLLLIDRQIQRMKVMNRLQMQAVAKDLKENNQKSTAR